MFTSDCVTIAVGQKTVLSDFSLSLAPGSVHLLAGPNGAGKSSFFYAIMGHPEYRIIQGTFIFNGQDITALAPDARARLGIFLAFQQPCAIPGVTVFTVLSEAYRELVPVGERYLSNADVRVLIEGVLEKVGLPKAYADRALHENFSGGEKKRLELAQLLLFKPKLVLLDEIDAGLDAQGLGLVRVCVRELHEENPATIFLIITHGSELVTALEPTKIHEIRAGRQVSVVDNGA
ncbi:ABC transporter ATP-binding protein [Candidatus Dependentiae bacterium HGW-Dependentiae-1]|nr:MAG: ABC transporter ATP-binding protein [Candidatus Dependentiae bacterium HGW-Dependentiae-1]